MKISISLPEDDVAFVDEYARREQASSRSAVLHKAVRLLRVHELGDEYEHAWREWEESGEAELWESTVSDGLQA